MGLLNSKNKSKIFDSIHLIYIVQSWIGEYLFIPFTYGQRIVERWPSIGLEFRGSIGKSIWRFGPFGQETLVEQLVVWESS
jgi:hypothetical protein